MKRPRLRPWRLGLTADDWASLTHRARAHGVTRPEYVRSLLRGHRPGATPGSAAAAADTWWDSRTPSRRVSIHHNHATAASETVDTIGQLTIFDEEAP